jgi:aryl-alcohol dehydrogenase-like predicted oxidoreductase
MQTRRIGSLDVSVVGVGCNNFGRRLDEAATANVVNAAIDAGINFFDTADIYGKTKSEEFLGRAIGRRRDDVIIATKFGMVVDEKRKGAHPDYLTQACEDSLRRLGTDYIDLYQAHKPDDDTPLEETLRAMDDLVRQGKVRYIGCSNYAAWQLVQGLGISREAGLASWISVQPRWNLLDGLADPQLLPACAHFGIGIIPYTPLASGILTGKYRAGEAPRAGTRAGDLEPVRQKLATTNLSAVDRLRSWAEARGHTVGELAVAWLLAHPVVSTVIVGARTPDQVQTNLGAVGWRLSPDDVGEVERLVRGTASE